MRRNSFSVLTFIALLPFGAAAQPLIQSQEGIALENQILQLQNQMQQLQNQVQQLQASSGSGGSALGSNSQPPSGPPSSGTATSSDIVGNLLNQVSQLQAQVQQLNGRVDTLQNEVDTQHAATEKEIGDLNFKLSNGVASGVGTPEATTPQNASIPQNLTNETLGGMPAGQTAVSRAPATPPLPPAAQATALTSPKTAIAAAQASLDRHDYAAAESDARAVLATAKSTPDGYKAQFILAEALYGEDKPQDAAIAYDDAYNRSRSGTYAPASLLGLANSLTDIQQQSAACDTLASLNSQFPTPPPGMGPRIQAAEKRAKCN